MKDRLIRDIKSVYNDKRYVILLLLTAICSYGFKISHPAMGIDDTPYAYYFEEGLAAVVGRWVLFVLNHLFSISEFAPFLTDFAAVLILAAAVTIWGALYFSALGELVPKYGYWFFSCLFLSCPLIAEVFTYYLHNGIAIGYLTCGISLYAFQLASESWRQGEKKNAVGKGLISVFMLTVALGCYESFMIVWLVGILMVFWAECVTDGRRILWKLCAAGVMAGASVIIRAVVINAVIVIFHLSYLQDAAVQRSLGELLGWILQPGAKAEFSMVLKRLFVLYGVFGYAYYPVRIFVYSVAVLCIYSVWKSITKKNVRILGLLILSLCAAFMLALVEGKATLYRSAQFLPLVCGIGILIATGICQEVIKRMQKHLGISKSIRGIYVLVVFIILWNQCENMNHWFYVDYMKYEYAKGYMEQIAYDLESGYDISKPILFTGNWENPREIVESAYVAYSSKTFYKMKRITDRIDEHLLEKFYRDYGVWVAQTPSLSVISWGKHAFGNDEQLIAFMRFHGHEFRAFTDEVEYEKAEEFAVDLPHFPQEGAIVDRGDYILIHF